MWGNIKLSDTGKKKTTTTTTPKKKKQKQKATKKRKNMNHESINHLTIVKSKQQQAMYIKQTQINDHSVRLSSLCSQTSVEGALARCDCFDSTTEPTTQVLC